MPKRRREAGWVVVGFHTDDHLSVPGFLVSG